MTKCDAIRGMEGWQPRCALPDGHAGPHEWTGLPDRGMTTAELYTEQGFAVRAALTDLRHERDLAPYGGNVDKKLRADNIRAWLVHEALEIATDNQRERYAAGELPEEEILTIARAVLFKGFGKYERWALSRERDRMVKSLRHAVSCTAHANTDLEFETVDGESDDFEPTAVEASNLAGVCLMAKAAELHPWLVRTGGTVKITPHTHWVTCGACEAEAARSSAKVSIMWGERELVREYSL